jgi:hypothetical protein
MMVEEEKKRRREEEKKRRSIKIKDEIIKKTSAVKHSKRFTN